MNETSTTSTRLGPMTADERRASAGLAGIYATRMLGLFLVLPVFALYGDELAGATPTLIGLAIGIYGLTQAILQIPLGIASDRWGRKPVIAAGLLVFALGSAVAATADGIYGMILGRALQGSGAVAAAIMALAADVTRDSQRTKIMAIIGISIGGSFLIALMLGPLLAAAWGLHGLFWLTTALAGVAILSLFFVVPSAPRRSAPVVRASGAQLRTIVQNADLTRLDVGIFALHLILTATFVALPVVLRDTLALAEADHWRVYIPVLLASLVVMVPVLGYGERRRRMHRVLPWVVLTLAMAQWALALALPLGGVAIIGALWLFFVAFNVCESSLPSLVSRYAPEEAKGAAMGIYSTAQFLGAFVGGVVGGALFGAFGASAVFAFCGGAAILWFIATYGLSTP